MARAVKNSNTRGQRSRKGKGTLVTQQNLKDIPDKFADTLTEMRRREQR